MSMSLKEYRQLMKLEPRPIDKPKKYYNKTVEVDGEKYKSKKEHRYHEMLKASKAAKDPAFRVVNVEREVYFPLLASQYKEGKLVERATGYYLDFRVTYADGRIDHVDTKSPTTRKIASYVIKRKLMLERHGVHVMEV